MKSTRTLTKLVLAAAALALVAAPIADAGKRGIKTTSSFGFFDARPGGVPPDSFIGQVASRNQACVKRRTVKVFKKTRRGRRNKRIGAVKTSPTGQWTIEKRRGVKRGRYFMRVVKKRVRVTRRSGKRVRKLCGAYRSSPIPVR